jgi:uncharacterized protein
MVIVWIAGLLFTIAFFAICAVCLRIVWQLMHPSRQPVLQFPEIEQLDYEEIEFRSRDQSVLLKGWFLPASRQPKMTIIFAHGYRGNRLLKHGAALGIAKELIQRGYQVLLFDFRNCGNSGGRLSTIGLDEQQDMLGAIDWCTARGIERIGLIGHSMGAATSLLAAAKCEAVEGVIADSPFSDLKRYLLDHLSVWSKLPRFPFSVLSVLAIQYIMGKNPQLVRPIDALPNIYPRPVLFIHGDADDAIPCSSSERMSERYTDAFSLWKVSGANHIGSYRMYPQEYTNRVIQFFDQLDSAAPILKQLAAAEGCE